MSVHKIKLSDFKAKKEEEGAIDVEVDDGTVFRIPPPDLWSDEVIKLVKDDDSDPVEQARAVMGDEYDAFVAAGGSAQLLNGIIKQIHGEPVPES